MSEVTAVPLRPVKRGARAKLWFGVVAAVLVAGVAAWAGTSRSIATAGTNEQFLAWHAKQAGVVTTASGLQYQVLKPGEGPRPTDSDVTLIKYVGSLRDGTVFDRNDRVPLPVNGVVPGFSEGLKLMSKGGHYRLWIPPELGYGSETSGPIPGGSVLVFDVELLDVKSIAEIQAYQQMQGMGGAPDGR